MDLDLDLDLDLRGKVFLGDVEGCVFEFFR